MKAIVYNTDTGEIGRSFNGPKQIIDNQKLDDNKNILTQQDINIPSDISGKRVDLDTMEIVTTVEGEKEERKQKINRFIDVNSRLNALKSATGKDLRTRNQDAAIDELMAELEDEKQSLIKEIQ